MAEDYKKSRVNYNEGGMCHETHQNFKYKSLQNTVKKVDAVSARHPASPHVRLLAP